MGELPHENDLQAHYSGATSMLELASLMTLFILLVLAAILVSNKVAHHWHLKWLPEAAAVIFIGIIASMGCRLVSGSIAASLMMFDANTFFVVLLPPIIFNSGYTLKRRFFFENLRSILSFAILGTFISNMVVGLLLYVVGQIGWSLQLSVAECLTFGALISATDPVSTLAIFQELHVDPTLFYIVFGESVLNDAVGIVLFETFEKFIGFTFTVSSMMLAFVDFGLIFVGSTLVGILFGLLSALMFKYFNFKDCVLHEVGSYLLFSYLPFLASTAVGMSGVVSVLFTGITMKHYTCNNISLEAQNVCTRFFNSIAHLTETVVFLNLGLTVFALKSGYHLGLIFWSIVACFLGRALNVYPLTALLNRKLAEPITPNQQHMLWFSGLRGAVAFALASSFPGEHKDDILATTMVIVLFTVFFMGGGTVKMLDYFNIQRLTAEQEQELDRTVRPIDRMAVLQWDDRYLVPFFTRPQSGKVLFEDQDGDDSSVNVTSGHH